MKISKAMTMVGTPKEDDCGELGINEDDEALEAMKKGQQVEWKRSTRVELKGYVEFLAPCSVAHL